MMESKDATLALPLPSQLDKWTSFDVFRYFKSKAIALSILDKELNIFIDERITGKHLIEITIHILRLAGFTIGSSMNIMVEINLLKNGGSGDKFEGRVKNALLAGDNQQWSSSDVPTHKFGT
ncbi:19434_t:CDS:2 [Rhizophagus irregularis]|nr:19434_t:CDS:2 [Rhizophagus irregularis]